MTLPRARKHVNKNTLSGSPRRENGTPSRWDQDRELLVTKRIPQKAQRWYGHT